MAKTGLIYYNVDTNRYQDRRIKRLKKDFKCDGIAVYDYILCEIYRVEGCFLVWDEDTAFDVSEYFGLKENTVNEIVKYCGAVGLFDKALLSRGIITSLSIQRRYLEMCKRAKRANAEIPEDICIQEEQEKTPEEIQKLPEVLPNTPEDIPQSKVKKSKVNIYLSSARENRLVFESLLPLMEELLNDQSCIEYFQRTAGAPYPDNDTISDKVKEFFVKLTVDGEDTKERKDAIYHFKSWYRQQAEVERTQNQKGGKNGTETRAAHNGANNKPAKETSRDYTKRF
ncbi:DUF4373 domain-containing protein [Dysgonomonas sp. 511]|uniref:DUF4373 domain-containing protein n=1 Tax=Dysgonomonas sp. 511 TaxID=2302930 RepID=UPI0013D2257B|nr:DUF4373 domain-containing protein [Dysgonomonas sp. 511]NDV77877.1 DUF4373 domain-containing protein [Dysgonomonas sp. 511]